MKRQKSFTLIELLVVIAIVGLLSSIVLIATKGARDRAQRVKVLQFSAQVHHALGAYAVGIWDFDEGSDTTAGDSSGYNNHGTLYNFTAAYGWVSGPDNTPCGEGYSLSFDGGDDYIHRSVFNNVPSSTMTLSAWIKTSSATKQLVVSQARRPQSINGEYLYFIRGDGKQLFWDYNGGYGYAETTGFSNTSVIDGNWHHIAFVKNGINGIYYLDGQVDGTKTASADRNYITNDFVIGKDYRGNTFYFNGLIDDVHIYSEALTSAQIKKLYAEGLERHKFAEK